MAEVNSFESVSGAIYVEGAVDIDPNITWKSNSAQEVVSDGMGNGATLNKSSKVDKLAQNPGPLNVVAQYLLGSSKLEPSTDSNSLLAEHNSSDRGDGSSHISSLSPRVEVEDIPGQNPVFAQNSLTDLTINGSAAIEPLASKSPYGIIPVSNHVYVGVTSELLDLDMFEFPECSVHGVFDGTTLKMSERVKREARPGGSTRRILDQSDLDQYCTGMSTSICLFSHFLVGQV